MKLPDMWGWWIVPAGIAVVYLWFIIIREALNFVTRYIEVML